MTNPEGGKANGFKGRGWIIRTRRWWVMLTTKGETRAGAPSLFSLYIRFQGQLFGKRLRCQAQTPAEGAPPNSPNLGTTTTSISWQTSGQNTACPHPGCHPATQRDTLPCSAAWTNLETLCKVKGIAHQRPHAPWFYLYTMFKICKL